MKGSTAEAKRRTDGAPRCAPSTWRRRHPVALLRLAASVTAATALLAACRTVPGDVLEIGSSLLPFERMPYVQAVDTSSARVIWRLEAGVQDSFRYRPSGTDEWRRGVVERAGEPIVREANLASLPAEVVDRRVELEGLPPSTVIDYVVFADTLELGPFSFRTAPRPGEGWPVHVLAFGDSGWGSEGQVRLAEQMELQEWHLAVHVGDIAYQSGTEVDFTLRHFQVYQRLLATVPFFPSPGDHDLRTQGGAPYDRAFLWPAPAPGARYYTFRWGGVRFIALEAGDESPAGLELRRGRGEQLEWLRRTLEDVGDDPTVGWTVIYLHAPPYSHAAGFGGHGSDFAIREVLTPLFDRYGVDLVLAGHDHHYERSHPILDGERVPAGCGPIYLVTGGGGASRYARATAPSSLSAASSRAYEFVRLVISEGNIEGEAIGVEGQTVDRFRVSPFAGTEGGQSPQCS